MAAAASLNAFALSVGSDVHEREEVGKVAAATECHLDVLIFAPDGLRVAGIDVRRVLDAHPIPLSGIVGWG